MVMKKLIYTLLCSIAIISNINSQWILKNSTVNVDLNSIYVDSTGVFCCACGNSGKIVISSNGGETWHEVQTNITTNLNSILFCDRYWGWAVGAGGKVISSSNGGENWYNQSSSPTDRYSIFAWQHNNSGRWALTVGDVLNGFNPIIRRTINGGLNWTDVGNSMNKNLRDIKLIDGDINYGIGFAVGGGTNSCIAKTYDGGASWTNLNITFTGILNSVCLINVDTIFIVGNNGRLLYSSNSGVNWTSNYISTSNLYSISFSDKNNGYIVGDYGTVIKTTDGGLNWNYQINVNGIHKGVKFINPNTGWIVSNFGTIYKTTNGGEPIGIQNISNQVPDNFSIKQN